MPLQTAQKVPRRDGVGGFLGTNLRRDRLRLEDGDVARAINADFQQPVGTAVLRLGTAQQFSTSLGGTIRRLAKHNGVRYQTAGRSLFANQTAILTTLSVNLFTTTQPFRHLNDTTEWVFIADDALMRKYDGTNVRNWGIAGATVSATVAAGSGTGLTGSYTGAYTYARVVGSSVATESNPTPASSAVALSNQSLDISVVASTDAQVTHIRVYRSAAGGTTQLFDQQVSNTTATIASSQADTALGAAVETDNAVPNNMSWVTRFQGHLFLCRDATNPHYLWWTKRFREEVPTSNFLEIGNPSDPLQCALPLAGYLGVFARETKYRVLGNVTSGFTWSEALSSRGTRAPQACVVTANGVLFPARDGVFLTNFLQEDIELTQRIKPLFDGQTVNDYAPIDQTLPERMALAEYKNRYYFAYQATDGQQFVAVYAKETGHWYHFDYGEDFRALYVEEDVDKLVAGGNTGLVFVLEEATRHNDNGADITMTLEPATRAGQDPYIDKLFHYLRADIDAKSGSVAVAIYIDDLLVHTVTVTGTRQRSLVRLPAHLVGKTWRVSITYTGQEAIAVHSIVMLYLPLRAL